MNTIWSDHVQGVKTLYLSRKLRFDDLFFSQYEASFQLDGKARLKILEIGCGPGALAEALHRWYPRAEITAIDRDHNFISFAKKNVPCLPIAPIGEASPLVALCGQACKHFPHVSFPPFDDRA